MKLKSENLHQLERLVDELVKAQPNQGTVQLFMKQAGLLYTPDPVEQLNRVLMVLQERREKTSKSNKKVRSHEPSV